MSMKEDPLITLRPTCGRMQSSLQYTRAEKARPRVTLNNTSDYRTNGLYGTPNPSRLALTLT